MNDHDCDETYRQLVSMMADLHMEWVVKDVEERFAREETQPFDKMSFEDHEQLTLFGKLAAMPKASLAERTSVAQRRLIMLIDGINHAVVHPTECRHFLFRYLSRKQIREIIFLSPDGDGRKLTLDKESILMQLDKARQLGHALQSLREAVVKEA
jgi:hypothetical protein